MSPTPASRRKASSHLPSPSVAAVPLTASTSPMPPALALYQQIKDHISRKIQDLSLIHI